jgi:hypothetical protein
VVERTGASCGRDDGLVRVAPVIERIGRFADLIETESDCVSFASLRSAGGAGIHSVQLISWRTSNGLSTNARAETEARRPTGIENR